MRIRTMALSILAFGLAFGLAACSSPAPARPSDPGLTKLTSTARLAYESGSLDQSIRLYRRALERARMMNDSLEIANNAYNLAACLMLQRQYAPVRALLGEAAQELKTIHAPYGDVVLLEAKLLRAVQHWDEASEVVERMIPAQGNEAGDACRAQYRVFRAQLACDTNDLKAAQSEMKKASSYLKGVTDPAIRAEAANAGGRIRLLEKEPAMAGVEFDRESGFFQQAGNYADMADALHRAGDAYRDSGNLLIAADRYYRAARSFHAQKRDLMEVLGLIENALSAADQAEDEAMVQRIVVLFDEVKNAVEVEKENP